ncbi:unnamed protein product [Diabrotica balteata]|uniref:Uncharacterized protein n=1 Tax=Diabrotica balteata TaxID=107213 RepID=A0A9P0E0C8_DIABA|nr:unnamed protein product [Diabrotica balteata]
MVNSKTNLLTTKHEIETGDSSEEDPFASSDLDLDPIYTPGSSTESTSDSSQSTVVSSTQNISEPGPSSGQIINNNTETVSTSTSRKRKRLPSTWKRNQQRSLNFLERNIFLKKRFKLSLCGKCCKSEYIVNHNCVMDTYPICDTKKSVSSEHDCGENTDEVDFSDGSPDLHKPSDSSEESDESDNMANAKKSRNSSRKHRTAQKDLAKKAMPILSKQENIKKCRLREEAYINRSGKAIGQKRPENVDCSKCKFKCAYSFTEEQRIAICAEYWAFGDTQKQKQMLSSLITTSVVVRRRTQATKPKQHSYKYHLKTCGGKLIRVCMKFLCKTLAISHRIIDDLHTLLSATGNYIGVDGRTGKKPGNSTSDHSIAQVKAHIDSFPRYCRRDTKMIILIIGFKHLYNPSFISRTKCGCTGVLLRV